MSFFSSLVSEYIKSMSAGDSPPDPAVRAYSAGINGSLRGRRHRGESKD